MDWKHSYSLDMVSLRCLFNIQWRRIIYSQIGELTFRGAGQAGRYKPGSEHRFRIFEVVRLDKITKASFDGKSVSD